MKALAAVAAAAALTGGATHAGGSSLIVFSADREPSISGDVYRADWNGRVVNLTHSAWNDSQPLVSPNGKLVAFLSDRGGAQGLWVIGVDGTGLRRVPALGFPSDQYVQMAWSPDGKTIALASGNVNRYALSLATPGGRPRVLVRSGSFGQVSWSPDGRLVTVHTEGTIDAYTPSGKKAWSVPSGGGSSGWSAQGFFATGAYDNRVHVVDERGRERFSAAAVFGLWSPDGTELATVLGKRLEIHTTSGKLVFRATLPVPNPGIQWLWPSRTAIVFANPYASGGFRIDLRTGRISPFAFGATGLNTSGSGTNWAVRNGAHVYTHVYGCDDDGGPSAAIANLQQVPGTRSIVYATYCAEPFDNLYAMNGDGSGLHRLTNVQAQETSPRISPDRTQIAYEWADATGLSCKGCPTSIRTMRLEGKGGATLTFPPDCTFDNSPSWSPNGTQISYSHSSCEVAPTLYTMSSSGASQRSLKVGASQTAWGPSLIAYLDGGTDPSSIWTVEPDGTGATKRGAGSVGSPCWSTDGRLAYVTGTNVFVAGRKVAFPFAQIRSITWSPDGTRLLVAAKPKGAPTFDLYSVETDGSDPVRLTTNMDVSSGDWR
ncbi:MAG TPA: LpqB family beta-propeller domain-containing protein [Gaiellaceae bacterium]|nr:LpqB family beta-propeller domain-containing protein [Gaiellaceae bacterium]